MITHSQFRFGFRVVGGRDRDRTEIDWNKAFFAHLQNDPTADNDKEVYLSAYQFASDFREHLRTQGSTKGFSGPTWSSWLWFDKDEEHDLEKALADVRRLVGFICDRWSIDADVLLLFFSGSKGFHVGVPTSLWCPRPGETYHAYLRRFAKCLASGAAVEIDTGVYDRVRLFRAPNSRHQKTGLHKRRLTPDEFFGMSATAILTLAQEPAESELPVPAQLNEQAVQDWNSVVSNWDAQVAADREKRTDDARLNALTRVFINEGALQGDRHRLLYSAARNLAEFASIADLALELLTTPGLDSGLPPSEVRRQIECGLKDGGQLDG